MPKHSETCVLAGSANFSNAGMRHNLEFMDDVSGYPDLAQARRESAEAFWDMGIDWTETALEILRSLIRRVSAEEAAARAVAEMNAFMPWKVEGNTTAGRPPQPFQSELVYEAAGTVYEHGFAFVEAPTGAGKTDIGKHLAAVLPVTHAETVSSAGERADQRRLGSLALVPASVLGNWSRKRPSNLSLVKHSMLARKPSEEREELDETNRMIRSSASMIVDESHRMSSRYLAPSARSLVFEQCPAIWTACLSATLMGNQGLDGLLAFHEKRSSIYVPPQITEAINAHMNKVRRRADLLGALERLEKRLRDQEVQEDLFDRPDTLKAEIEQTKQIVRLEGLEPREIQADLAQSLAPFVVRRQRHCIGESADRRTDRFTYPTIRTDRRDTKLTQAQSRVIARIKTLAEAITTGTTLISSDPKRAGQAEIRFHDKSRIHIRNFLAVLRSSITFARIEWLRERDSETVDQRGRKSIGESLRNAERSSRRPLQVPSGELPEELPATDEESSTPICDRIKRLLESSILESIDETRAEEMMEILNRHGQVILLAERIGVLDVYSRHLARMAKRDTEIFVVAPGAKLTKSKRVTQLRSGSEAQDYFSIDGKHKKPLQQRAIFLTFQMAEGINLQQASALGIIGIGLTGIAKALEEQRRSTAFDDLTFEERLGILVDREAAERDGKKLTSRLKFAALRQDASVEDLDLRTPRGLDRSVMAHLADGGWIARHENLLITGSTGLGKSWIACALGHKACRDGRPVLYQRAPRMFEALALARGDGRHERILKTIARMDVLIIDDWGLAILTAPERRDLLEILEDRHGRASTIVTSQLPVEHWHEAIGDPTLADAILDRLVHNAHRLKLTGESMRKAASRNTSLDLSAQA